MSQDERRFPGFPAGAHATAIPNVFFSDLLRQLDDPAELLVTLYAFYALGRRRAAERWLTGPQLAAEAPLRAALAGVSGGPDVALQRGLTAAVARGTLVAAAVDGEVRYAVNSPFGRRLLASGAGEGGPMVIGAAGDPPPNIYALYEEAIGTISPLVADELRAAEEEYPQEWIEAAFREAAAQNRRSWRYVARILERWRDEGRHDATVGRDLRARRDFAGRYRSLIRR
jgi:DnaD/phage-associated family protein